MIFISVCSGIEAASVAWGPLGWRAKLFAEIASFPSLVLAHHYPDVPNVGDFTEITDEQCTGIDLLVGGTPCQDFSVAGLRAGMAGERGALSLEFLRLAARARPRWIVWENVPGVLSADGGRALGAFLGGLAELGYGFAWRVLDAQHFGLAQRRKRLFVVGHAGGQWQRAAAVLLERASLRGDPRPSTAAREGAPAGAPERAGRSVSPALKASLGKSGGNDYSGDHLVASTLGTRERGDMAERTLIAGTLGTRGDRGHFDGSQGDPRSLIPIPFDTTQITSAENRTRCAPGDHAPTLTKRSHAPAIAFHATQDPISGAVAPASGTEASGSIGVMHDSRVRRLTPRECERLMGFPDDWTAIPGAKDGPRYAALGNSIAVPVLGWIGERIARVDALTETA